MPQNAVEPLAPETSNSYYEVSLAASIIKFHVCQTNFSDSFQGALVTRLTNAGDVSSRGIEGDLTFRPADPLNIGFNFAYTDATIDRFNCSANATCTNFDGQPLPYAPNWKAHVDATYTVPLSDTLGLELNSDYSYRTKTQYSITQTPDTIQPAYGIWNASISLVVARNRHDRYFGVTGTVDF